MDVNKFQNMLNYLSEPKQVNISCLDIDGLAFVWYTDGVLKYKKPCGCEKPKWITIQDEFKAIVSLVSLNGGVEGV